MQESATYHLVARNSLGEEDACSADVEVRPPSRSRSLGPSPFRAKWRPWCHSSQDSSSPPLMYRSVKAPKMKRAETAHPRATSSPPGPHEWESHEEIESLEKSLRQSRQSFAYDIRGCSSLGRQRFTTSLKTWRPPPPPPPPLKPDGPRVFSAPPSPVREFVSVRTRAQQLEEQNVSTPGVRPEKLAGAVRVLPPSRRGSGNTDTLSSTHSFEMTTTNYHQRFSQARLFPATEPDQAPPTIELTAFTSNGIST